MKKKIYIYNHQGLGDHIHCNGLVRFIIEKNPNSKIYIFVRENILKMVKFMYRDEDKIKIVMIPKKIKEENQYVEDLIYKKKDIIFYKVGFEYIQKNHKNINVSETADSLFYRQLKIPYKKRFQKTYWKRDLNKERRVYNKLIEKKPYVFIHDDASRGFFIPDKLINSKFDIIRNDKSNSIFDYGLILENASEIHLMESSIRCMLEFLNPHNCKFYLYKFKNMDHFKSVPFYKKGKMIGSKYLWNFRSLKFNLPIKNKIIKLISKI